MKVVAQIPRKFLGFHLPFFYKTIELEVSDDGIITTNPILQKGEEVQLNLEYKGSHDQSRTDPN
jgi:hypothetical protein